MASKQPLKLLDTKKFAISLVLKTYQFFKHTIFRQKRQILIIGDESQQMFKKISLDLSDKCRVTCICNSTKRIEKQTNKQINYLSLKQLNYSEIQKQLFNKKFNAIIVTPLLTPQLKQLELSNEEFVINFSNIYSDLLMKNILGYRLASKYLTKLGVIVLSCNEEEIIKNKNLNKKPVQQNSNIPSFPENSSFIQNLLSAQLTYLAVVIGDRDHTDLHSSSVIALNRQNQTENIEVMVEYYKSWATRKMLPAPGSFAKLKPACDKTAHPYMEYL